MRIENQYSRRKRKENSLRKRKYSKETIANNVRIQEEKMNERMKEIERAEKEAWKRARERIV